MFEHFAADGRTAVTAALEEARHRGTAASAPNTCSSACCTPASWHRWARSA